MYYVGIIYNAGIHFVLYSLLRRKVFDAEPFLSYVMLLHNYYDNKRTLVIYDAGIF